jgi:hypothetical protein
MKSNSGTPIETKGWLHSLNGKIVSVTAFLVVIPALINGGIDVYKAAANVPKTIYEINNYELFKKHFKHKPVLSQPIPIKTSEITVDMLLEVYENGDIFVKYGEFEQWFPFKSPAKTSWVLFKDAYAETGTPKLSQSQIGSIGTMGALMLINALIYNNAIDIDKAISELAKIMIQEKELKPSTINKSYIVAEIKDDHPNIFSDSSQEYSVDFQAEDGYKVTQLNFRLTTADNFQLRGIEKLDDGKSVRITFTLNSGPFLHQWTGWVKGILETKQQRISDSQRDKAQ